MEATYYPCDEGGIIDRAAAPREIPVEAANLPAGLLVGWHEPCAQPRVLDSIVEKRYSRTRRAEVLILAIQCAVSGTVWFLVDGYPLVQPQRWWLEPVTFITACTIPVAPAALLIPDGFAFQVPIAHPAAMIPAVIAILVWRWWFGLLIRKTFRFAFRSFVGFKATGDAVSNGKSRVPGVLSPIRTLIRFFAAG